MRIALWVAQGGVTGVAFDPHVNKRVIAANTDGMVRVFVLNIDVLR